MNLLIDTYVQITGGQELNAIRLTQGYGNMSVEAGRALWELSKLALATPVVRTRLLAMADEPAQTVQADLEGEESAETFFAACLLF